MDKKYKFLIFIPIIFLLFLVFIMFTWESHVEVLSPKGWIGLKQSDLLVLATLVMLLVVIPVFMLTFLFPWKYRAGNKAAKYSPDFVKHHIAEAVWWGLPCVIVLVLSVIVWKSSHELDPYRPIESETKTMTIQVVALQWNWLFIYPEQEIASTNFFQFPVNTPIHFEITSDAPMNSFWIPELGGQIYAMPSMQTDLHLIANETGSFDGVSANLSGIGFSGMTFVAKASTQEEFEDWVQSAKQSPNNLSRDEYQILAKPSTDHPVKTYQLASSDLFKWIIMKYMMPQENDVKSISHSKP
jgi:cytochrome o ubiquinol oxidase subunit 2